jgi:hypothetical protein
MFGLGFLGKLGALASSVARAWSPLALWPDGISSAGMWISPRDLASQWADYTGTTPVATPGTVADSSNPVGLAYDLRAGDPALGTELLTNGDFSDGETGWVEVLAGGSTFDVSGGQATLTRGTSYAIATQNVVTPGKQYRYTLEIVSISGTVSLSNNGGFVYATFTTPGMKTVDFTQQIGTTAAVFFGVDTDGGSVVFDNVSVKEILGNHMLQSTSAARPLASAYDGQTLGPGDTYDGTGYPIFQLYDGVDDGMATAAFPAGTFIDGMDCLIAVRRDSAEPVVAGLYTVPVRGSYFGHTESETGEVCHCMVGTPTTWVDGAQLTGGTSVTADTLNTALSTGSWHIIEFQGLDLSIWTKYAIGEFGDGYNLNGALGDILLYPSTASTTDKDAARQWLASYYGVTLP